jgi:hypothetical protein
MMAARGTITRRIVLMVRDVNGHWIGIRTVLTVRDRRERRSARRQNRASDRTGQPLYVLPSEKRHPIFVPAAG